MRRGLAEVTLLGAHEFLHHIVESPSGSSYSDHYPPGIRTGEDELRAAVLTAIITDPEYGDAIYLKYKSLCEDVEELRGHDSFTEAKNFLTCNAGYCIDPYRLGLNLEKAPDDQPWSLALSHDGYKKLEDFKVKLLKTGKSLSSGDKKFSSLSSTLAWYNYAPSFRQLLPMAGKRENCAWKSLAEPTP